MLNKLFKSDKSKSNKAPIAAPSSQQNTAPSLAGSAGGDQATAALLRAIDEKRAEDPLIGMKIGAKEVLNLITTALTEERGVHIESLLSLLGSVAGYTCQASLREAAIHREKMPEDKVFMVLGGKDGRKYFFGNFLNTALLEQPHSLLAYTFSAAHQLGWTEKPNIEEIIKAVADKVGSDEFGIPNIPDAHKAHDLPINYVLNAWPVLFPTIRMFCKVPNEWPVLMGMATHNAILMSKGILDPTIAARIVMESAIPMSKVNIEEFNHPDYQGCGQNDLA